MGQLESTPSYYKQVERSDGSFVIVTNEPDKSFQFRPSESYSVYYGIDYQSSPKFKHKTLSSISVTDAKLMRDSLVCVGAFPLQNTRLYSASSQPEECKFEGIKITFQEVASKVGPNGLLLFHFSGHGIKVGKDEWGLAPVDFDYSRQTYLTAGVLADWLNEVKCRAKQILFTLDCCYAGGIGRELTAAVNVQFDADIYVISACADYETSLVIGPLENSIFVYFLSYALLRSTSKSGVLPLKDIFSLCQVCCESLSSLLIRYSDEYGLKLGTMRPEMGVLNLHTAVKNLLGEGEDQVDASTVGRFQFALNLYDYTKPIPQLAEKSFAYLETVASLENGPLLQLEQNGVLDERVLNAVICSLMYSVASIELVCDPDKLLNPNLSVTAFVHCVASIDLVHTGVEFTENVFFASWLFYREVLTLNKVNTTGLRQLHRRLSSSDVFSRPLRVKVDTIRRTLRTNNGPVDMTDSAEVSCHCSCYILKYQYVHVHYTWGY